MNCIFHFSGKIYDLEEELCLKNEQLKTSKETMQNLEVYIFSFLFFENSKRDYDYVWCDCFVFWLRVEVAFKTDWFKPSLTISLLFWIVIVIENNDKI